MPGIDNDNAREAHTSQTPARRSQSIRFAQRKQMSRLLTLGHSQAEIAEHLSLSEATVSREVSKMKSEFVAQTKANLSELQTAELSKLAEVESAAWLSHAKTGSEGALNTILKVVRTRAAILGYDSPDARAVVQMLERGQETIIQAVINTFGEESDHLRRLMNEIERLEADQHGGFPRVVEIVEAVETERVPVPRAKRISR